MKKIFTDKKIRYGAFSTVIALVFIAFLIVINLVIGEFDHKFDFTSAETYSIGEKSHEVLKNLNEDITIYTLFKTGSTDSIVSRVQKVLDQYDKDPHITVENKDLYLYPDFTKKYSEGQSIGLNSIIVTNGDRYKVINYEEYFDSTGILNVESCVTGAINYVGLEKSPVVYVITGHGEYDFNVNFARFVKQGETAGYEFKELNLLESDIPDDCGVLLVTNCSHDYSENEVMKIMDYLSNDGRLMFAASAFEKNSYPNMLRIINNYGVDLGNNFILEGNSDNYIMYPYSLLPVIEDHSINSSLKENNYRVLAEGCFAVKTLDLKKQGLQIETLLRSTEKAIVKGEGNKYMNYEEGDETGPFTVAAAITDATYTDKSHSTKLIVIGNFNILLDNSDEMVSGGNTTFLVNSLNWLNDMEDSIFISPKSLANEKIVIDNGSVNKIKLFAWGVIPGALFIAGFVVWLIRRNG